MNKTSKKIIAALLCVLMLVPFGSMGAFAASSGVMAANSGQIFVEKLVGGIFDGIIGGFGTFMKSNSLDTYDEYMSKDNPYFYDGTNGAVSGDGWSLGYSAASVIPEKWRRNANGDADPNGYCLNGDYYFGGYFTTKTDKIYDDQRVNVAVISCGSDSNNNGVEDIMVFASLDGVGFGNRDVIAVRKAAVEKLKAYGVENSDIITFNVSSTHAHSVIDPQGIGLDVLGYLFLAPFTGNKMRSAESELLQSITDNTSDAVAAAYKDMKDGELYFYETPEVVKNGKGYEFVADKREFGQAVQDKAGCFMFEAADGEKTVLTNLATHPTKADRDSGRVCADFPYYVGEAMNDLGYNLVYLQGAQGAVGLSLHMTNEGRAYADSKALSLEQWAERYGKSYADEKYADEKDEYYPLRAGGYTFAKLIVDSSSAKVPVSAKVDVKAAQVAVPLDFGLLYLGAVTQLLGFNCVKYKAAQSGYAIMTEIGAISIGDDVTIVTTPGETFPAIIYGTDETYTGEKLWTGPTSWKGKDWQYKSVEEYVRAYTGDDDKVVLALGLCNDAVGYIIPDTDASHFSIDWFYGDHYEELLTCSDEAGSAIAQAFADMLSK